MNIGASLRKTSSDDSERTMDEIMATIRDIISRDGSSTDDSDDYVVPVFPCNNNDDETLLLEMEDQLRSEVDNELSARFSVTKFPGTTLVSELGGRSVITSDSVASALMLRHSDDIRLFLESKLTPLVHRWLSENLPLLAERLVRSELERVSSELDRTAS